MRPFLMPIWVGSLEFFFRMHSVLVVVDASNKYARKALDPEVLKVLHFFADKESVLVLNKVTAGFQNCALYH